jgi:hypothetical protein
LDEGAIAIRPRRGGGTVARDGRVADPAVRGEAREARETSEEAYPSPTRARVWRRRMRVRRDRPEDREAPGRSDVLTFRLERQKKPFVQETVALLASRRVVQASFHIAFSTKAK